MAKNEKVIGQQRISRFEDVVHEPNKMLMPISGYENMKLVSIEEAVQPLVSLLPTIQSYAYSAKQRCERPVPNGLTIDQSASIMLYTMGWEPSDQCLYYALNKALRTENRSILKPWFLYLKLVLTALSRLPSASCSLFRGVKRNLHQDYKKGTTRIWWGFSSCTSTVEVLETKEFYGKEGPRTLFTIQCINAKDISRHSYFSHENEMLLLPATQLEVVSSLDQGNGLCMIQLKETLPPVFLLHPVVPNSTDSSTSHSHETITKFIENNWSSISNTLPPSVDLRAMMPPAKDQGTSNTNVVHAAASAYEYLLSKRHKQLITVSRLFIYYNSRCEDGLTEYNMSDAGTQILSTMTAMSRYGCCKEDLYPYILANINRKPPQRCYTEAIKYRVNSGVSIDTNLHEMKACLAEGYPFIFGLQIFQSFINAEKNHGRVNMPQPSEVQQIAGWHAMLAVGYSDVSQCFIVLNSWGDSWGDHGYCYIPYDYMCNPRHCRSLHAIKSYTTSRDY